MYKLEELKTIYKALDDKLATDIVVLDISKISSLTTYFIIASASNVKQIEALCDNVEFELKQGFNDVKILKEGIGTTWSLIDAEFCYIHIFHEEQRDTFNLERLWADAEVIDIKTLQQ